ncbi:hypothetical protein E2C01_016331 [Portunus trituberculatus]|uniref:C2H2-type domain-containing protein n=1 Tax=Portunus trituberculatus TaxID=210409 RepID=A0A5B7DQB4_PORTR|nr:hypothetical protein [Portunus trituberculatus]
MAESRGNRSPTCPTCSRTFANFQGRRVHEQSQHPSSFHAGEVESLKTERRKARWDPEELAMMAENKAKHPRAKYINQEIKQHVLPHRTIEGIKGARRTESYKVQVRAAAVPSSPPSVLDPRGLTSPITSGSSQETLPSEPNSLPSLGLPAAGSPQPPPPHIRSEEEVHACVQRTSYTLGLSVPTCIGEVEHQVDLWCPPSAYVYRPPGRGGPSDAG